MAYTFGVTLWKEARLECLVHIVLLDISIPSIVTPGHHANNPRSSLPGFLHHELPGNDLPLLFGAPDLKAYYFGLTLGGHGFVMALLSPRWH